MAFSNAAKAGTALFVASVQFGLGLVLAEIYYPNYNVSTNYISDLGATCNSTCVIHEPSSLIFNSSIVLLGLLVLVAAYFLQKAFHWRPLTVVVTIGGLGAVGVGLFPETTGVWHEIFSAITFLFTGLSAVAAFKVARPPLSYFSVILGLITLASMVLFLGGYYLGLGPGGMERLIVYPVLLWSMGFGGHLMSMQDGQTPAS
ncbi:MAG TPA: DUF998 domain-containing protein [Nitrososphaerales archaeon]|nr:DUF998 domain-containing protein [Nitrososphaerales archaeon]